jgi:hypothetical protein
VDKQEVPPDRTPAPASNRTALTVVIGFCVALALLIALNMK